MILVKIVFWCLLHCFILSRHKVASKMEDDLISLSRRLTIDAENEVDDFGLPEDYDYEVDDNADKFKTLSDRTLLFFIENFRPEKNNSELGIKEDEIVTLMNTRPEIVVLMSQDQLEGILVHRPYIIHNISRETALALAGSSMMTDKIATLPKNVFAEFVINNTFVQDFLMHNLINEVAPDSDLPAAEFFRKLLIDVEFLRIIPLKLHLRLADSSFVRFLTIDMIKAVLKAKPELPLYLNTRGMMLVSSLLQKPGFIENLPCSAILNGGSHAKFMNRLNSDDLRALAKSAHVWKCLPIDVIRDILKNNRLGEKISFKDVLNAAKVMSSAKRLDSEVVVNLFKVQFPQIAQRGIDDMFD